MTGHNFSAAGKTQAAGKLAAFEATSQLANLPIDRLDSIKAESSAGSSQVPSVVPSGQVTRLQRLPTSKLEGSGRMLPGQAVEGGPNVSFQAYKRTRTETMKDYQPSEEQLSEYQPVKKESIFGSPMKMNRLLNPPLEINRQALIDHSSITEESTKKLPSFAKYHKKGAVADSRGGADLRHAASDVAANPSGAEQGS